MPETLQLKNVLITAPALDRALVDFESFGAEVAFRDGDSYAALDPASMQLGVALAAPHDHPAPGELVFTGKAAHVAAAADALVAAGAELITAPQQGGHEVRALIRTVGGLLIMIYGPEV
jgi:lactoylglutathione lyase